MAASLPSSLARRTYSAPAVWRKARSAPPTPLPKERTAPLIAASLDDFVDDLPDLGNDFGIDDVQRAAGHVPCDERDAVGVRLETKFLRFMKDSVTSIRRVR